MGVGEQELAVNVSAGWVLAEPGEDVRGLPARAAFASSRRKATRAIRQGHRQSGSARGP